MTTTSSPQKRSFLWYGFLTVLLLIGLAGCDQATTSIESEEEPDITSDASKDSPLISPGEIVQITTDPADQMSPDISNNRLVYEDNRNGNWDIYSYCIDTQIECRITTNPADQRAPDISNGRIVWEDYRVESGRDIFFYDMSDQTERQLTFSPQPDNETEPEIHGDYAIWYSGFRWYYNVYMFEQDSMFTIGNTGPGDRGYGISGDYAILTGVGGTSPSELYLCDLSVGSDEGCEILFQEEGRAENPDIYRNYVVWSDDRNGNFDIFLYDMNTEAQTQITSDEAEQRDAIVYGDHVVWVDTRNGNDDIYMYNIETQEETQITTNADDQRSPAIFKDYIVWEDNRNGNWDIYMYEISE